MTRLGETSATAEEFVYCRAKLNPVSQQLAPSVDTQLQLADDTYPSGGPGNDPYNMVFQDYILFPYPGRWILNVVVGMNGVLPFVGDSRRLRVSLRDQNTVHQDWICWAEQRSWDWYGGQNTEDWLQGSHVFNVPVANWSAAVFAWQSSVSQSIYATGLMAWALRVGPVVA